MTGAPPPYGKPWPPRQSDRKPAVWLLVGLAVFVVVGLAAGGVYLLLDDRTPRETAEAFVNSYADGDCQAAWDLMSARARERLGDANAIDAPKSFCDRWKLDPGERFTIVHLVTLTQNNNEATVKITTRSTANGEETVTLHLVKAGDEWQIGD
jgi:Domain of unknown function (DUF4878)